jgi:hypothetical protein
MKFTEEKLERAFVELLGQEVFPPHLGITITHKRINSQLKNTIKPLCPVLMKGVVENLSKLATIEN